MKLTDSALAHQALECARHRADAKAATKKAKTHSDAVVAELARRRLSPAEVEALSSDVADDPVARVAREKLTEPIGLRGVRVVVVAGTRTTYDLDQLRELVAADVLERVTVCKVDTDAMTTEIEMGRVAAIDVGPASHVSASAPHIVVTVDAA